VIVSFNLKVRKYTKIIKQGSATYLKTKNNIKYHLNVVLLIKVCLFCAVITTCSKQELIT